MLGVFLSPHYATDHNVYLTYAEPGRRRRRAWRWRGPSSSIGQRHGEPGRTAGDLARRCRRAAGGQFGAQIAFSPDGQYLFLTVGDRQRMTPAQDPNQPLGKILRLTLDGKPAPGNPMAGKTGAASVPLINPPRDTEAAKTAPVVSTYTFPGRTWRPPRPGPAVIARPTVWPSRPTAGCGRSSTARGAATS